MPLESFSWWLLDRICLARRRNNCYASISCASNNREVKSMEHLAALIPAIFGLLGVTLGGYLTFFRERRAARKAGLVQIIRSTRNILEILDQQRKRAFEGDVYTQEDISLKIADLEVVAFLEAKELRSDVRLLVEQAEKIWYKIAILSKHVRENSIETDERGKMQGEIIKQVKGFVTNRNALLAKLASIAEGKL